MSANPPLASACPLCGSGSRTWTRRFGRELRRCVRCRFAWVPEGVLRTQGGHSIYEDDSSFFMTDEQSEYYRDESTIEAARDKLAWVAQHARRGGRLLDVGANFGFFVTEARGQYDALGIEPSPPVVQWGRAHLQAPLEIGTIDRDRPDFHGRFDAITLFDVIEHLPDPRSALLRCRSYLAPGGRLFLTTPDSGSLMARLLGSEWYYVDLKEHVSLFNAANLDALLTETGFVTVATRTIGRRYKCSYIDRRLAQLASDTPLLRAVRLLALPLRLWPDARIPLNLRDVIGVVAEKAGSDPLA